MARRLEVGGVGLRGWAAACGWVILFGVASAGAQGVDHDAALQKARDAMRQEAGARSMPELLQGANHGDAVAMRELGFVYGDGLSAEGMVRQANPRWGLQWFQRAAVKGDVQSVSFVGDRYAAVPGRADYGLARVWYEKAYGVKDARGTTALAGLYCAGLGIGRDLARCGRLLDEASGFRKDGDAEDTKPALAAGMYGLGREYQAGATGAGKRRELTLAAGWYAKSAGLGRPSAAVALSRLYVERGNFQRDLKKATAVLDGYLATQPMFYGEDAKDAIAVYGEIGAGYEKMGGVGTARAIPVYRQSGKLGDYSAYIALAMRYARGDRLPRNLGLARRLMTDGMDTCSMGPASEKYRAAVVELNGLLAKYGAGAPIRHPSCAFVAPAEAAASIGAPQDVEARYPNMLAPNVVGVGAKFPVLVSLNTAKLDGGTTIISGDQKDGQLLITIPEGMTSILIAVNLVAPDMTSVDGISTQTIELTKDRDSTTAVFQLQAGAAAGKSSIFATLTYNGAFIGFIKRDVMVGVANTLAAGPATQGMSPVAPPRPPIVGMDAPLLGAVAPVADAAVKRSGIHLNVEARAPDMTIQEIQDGTKLIYTVSSPLLPGFEKSVELNAAARQAIVGKTYSDLEARGDALDQIGGKNASQQAKDFAEGLGDDLYDHQAPDAFKKVYQKLKKLGAPPQTIEVLTDEPSLPWELMRPMTDDGKREDFLGFTASVVHSLASLSPRVPPPPAVYVEEVAVVVPSYSGALTLGGAQAELTAMKASFPGLESVPAKVTDVSNMVRELPNGIIHFAGHGIRVAGKGMPPEVGILLNDGSMIPSTWMGLAENSTSSHPFYFFNACDLGQSDAVLNYVDGWAPKLMQSGASGYLGALWKVSDKTATSFSGHFYTALGQRMKGKDAWSVADVVSETRKQTYAEQFDPTALAYVLYAAPYLTMNGASGITGGTQ